LAAMMDGQPMPIPQPRVTQPVLREEFIMPQVGHAHAPMKIERVPTADEGVKDVEHTEVEEVLSLQQREKELIRKALVKHRGRRKNAAQELGISERTLYRKINEYDLEE